MLEISSRQSWKSTRIVEDIIKKNTNASIICCNMQMTESIKDIFKKNNLISKDFVFLDPPYDTDFKDYEKASFDKKDQERLARCLYATKAKFILIIKNTPFILNLYKNKPRIKISSFDKTYLYNVKGRNDREVEHLIIKNF